VSVAALSGATVSVQVGDEWRRIGYGEVVLSEPGSGQLSDRGVIIPRGSSITMELRTRRSARLFASIAAACLRTPEPWSTPSMHGNPRPYLKRQKGRSA